MKLFYQRMYVLYSLTHCLSTNFWTIFKLFLAGLERIELPPSVSKTEMISISPKPVNYLWHRLVESNHYSHFRRMLSYPLNESGMVLLERIELSLPPYQRGSLPLTYKSVVPKIGLEPTRFSF